MSVSGVSGSTQNPLLQTLLDSMPSLQSGSSAAATSTGGSSASYLLSLGSQQAEGAVIGYNQLGKLINQAEDTLAGVGQTSTLTTAGGFQASTSYAVDVQQLATAQSVSGGSYPDADKTVVGTGTLTIETGSLSTNGQTLSASGTPVTVTITDGTLNGIASAINNAKAGVTASVVQGSDGSYQLVVTGSNTGAANAFSLSGVTGLTYDPTGASSSALTLTQAAQDAHYTVNGAAQTSATNTNAAIAPGVVSTLSALGPTTVAVPFGQQRAVASAQNLTSSFNSLLSSISQLTGSGGALSADPSVAFSLAQALSSVTTMTFSGGKTLASIGITAQSDGTLAIDQATLQAAYAADPNGTNAAISGATAAIRQNLASLTGPSGTIEQETRALVTVMCQGSSSLDALLPSSDTSNASSMLSALGSNSSTSSTSSLADYLLALSNSSNASSDPLLSALGSGTGQ